MRVLCEMSAWPLGIRGTVMKWVFCPYLGWSKRKVQKTDIKKCEECSFFIGIKIAERPGDIAYLGSKMKRAKPAKVAGYIRMRPIIGEKARQPDELKRKEAIYAAKELESKLEPLTDLFDEGDKVRVLAEIPFHYQQEKLSLEYERKTGGGELIIRAEDYERRVPIQEELATELTGGLELRSFKSGIVNAELKKERKDI